MSVEVANRSEFILRVFLVGAVSAAIAGVTYLACYKWAPHLLTVASVTLTPDYGVKLPFTYPRGFDILMALLWGMMGAFLLSDISAHIETKWAFVGMVAGFLVGIGFLPTVGMAILPHLVLITTLGFVLGLSNYGKTNGKDDRSLLLGCTFGTCFVLGLASLGLVLSLILGLLALGAAITARELARQIIDKLPSL